MTALQDIAVRQKKLLWNSTIKNHNLFHFASDSSFLAPHTWACYKWEDFVGQISRLCKQHTAGLKHTALSLKAIQSYALYLTLLYKEEENASYRIES